jgi:branched-subunit amino acid transport protein
MKLLLIIFIMAAVTYIPRVIPLVIFRKKIKNKFVQSFLLYIPYGILAAMTFPSILYSTQNIVSAICACVVALILAYKNLGLLPVALGATATVFIVEKLILLL